MTAKQAILLHLGPLAAKAVMKFWFKDLDFVSELAEAGVRIAGGQLDDMMAKKECIRQFDEIGDKISQSVYSLVVSKKYDIADTDVVNAVMAIKEVIDSTTVDDKMIFDNDLDSDKLFIAFEANRKLNKIDVPGVIKLVYNDIFNELCSLIVDISRQLPSFSQRSFSELFSRNRLLVSKVDELIETVTKIRNEVSLTEIDVDVASFEAEYLISCVRKMDYLTLFGLDTSGVQRQQLSVSYVSLVMETEGMVSRCEEGKRGAEKAGEYFTIEDVLSRSDRILITGNAGCGKTTLLQWVGVRSASGDFDEITDWNKRIPFFIKLRSYVDSSFPALDNFVTDAIPFQSTLPRDWVHNRLSAGEAVVLIDGVDEIPKLKRVELEDWIHDLVGKYPKSKYIITTRPHATNELWLAQYGFEEAELQLLELDDIYNFIDHWHQAVAQTNKDPEERDKILSYRMNLKHVVKSSQAIRRLASTPLLCAVICALHSKHREHLPRNRVELYDECCKMLIDRRDVQRNVSLKDYPQLDYSQKISLLQAFAYYLMRNNWSTIGVDRADAFFDRQVNLLVSTDKRYSGKQIRELFVERTSIIREPVVGEIDFTHRTFQEYLAARAAVYEGDTGHLLSKANDDMWREVVILAAGVASKEMKKELLLGLLEIGKSNLSLRHQAYLLAVACLETSVEIDQNIRDGITRGLAKVVPPRNFTEAKYISSAGELALQYLKNKKRYNVKTACSCIRALSLIGGDRALEYIEEYRKDSRLTVRRELSKSITYFDSKSYANKVLLKNDTVGLFEVCDERALPRLAQVKAVKRLLVSNCDFDFRELANFNNVTHFGFQDAMAYRVDDITMLDACEFVHFEHCSLWFIEMFLSYTSNVKEVSIYYPRFDSNKEAIDFRRILSYPVDALYLYAYSKIVHNYDINRLCGQLYLHGASSNSLDFPAAFNSWLEYREWLSKKFNS